MSATVAERLANEQRDQETFRRIYVRLPIMSWIQHQKHQLTKKKKKLLRSRTEATTTTTTTVASATTDDN